METTICFQNDKILVLSGKYNGKQLSVRGFRIFELSEGSIINGVITDSFSIRQVLSKIKSDKTLFCKDVRVIIDSSLIYIKQAVFPLVSDSKMNIFVENEFVGFDSKNSEMIFDYSVLSHENGKKVSVACFAMEKSLAKSFIDIFAEEGIKLSAIDVSTNCVIKYTVGIPMLKGKTYVIASVDNNSISLMLFVNNKYYYSTRARILSDADTEDFFQEISSQVSSIVQFNKSQRNGFQIEEIFLFGLTDRQSAHCGRYISDLGIQNSPTLVFGSVVNSRRELNPSDYIYNIGSLLRK